MFWRLGISTLFFFYPDKEEIRICSWSLPSYDIITRNFLAYVVLLTLEATLILHKNSNRLFCEVCFINKSCSLLWAVSFVSVQSKIFSRSSLVVYAFFPKTTKRVWRFHPVSKNLTDSLIWTSMQTVAVAYPMPPWTFLHPINLGT